MRVRQGKTMAELGLTRPRVFRQWKLGKEPPQFGDLSVTEAQIYLATGSDIEAIFLDEERGHSPGFWAKTDPVYDPHWLVTSADALNRPYIGMQIAIPAQWVEVTVRYSKQTAQTLAKLGRTGRNGYRAAKEQIRSRRQPDPVALDDTTSCGCGLNDNHRVDGDWIELPRVLTSDGVLHVLRVWPVTACGQSDPNWYNWYAARTFEPRRHLETEKPWQYCPRCWPIAKRRLLDLSREQMMGEAHRSVASEAVENGASWEAWLAEQPPIDVEKVILGHPSVLSVSFRADSEQVTVRAGETITSQVGMTQDSEGRVSIEQSGPVVVRGVGPGEVEVHLTGITSAAEADLLSRLMVLDPAGVAHGDSHEARPFGESDAAIPGVVGIARTYCGVTDYIEDVDNPDAEFSHLRFRRFVREQCGAYCARCLDALDMGIDLGKLELRRIEDLPLPAGPEQEQIPTFLLTESKVHLPTILQKAGLATSRAQARTGINAGSVSIEGWPSIAHRHTFKSADLDGKLLRIGGRPALRFTAQVGDDSPERTDS